MGASAFQPKPPTTRRPVRAPGVRLAAFARGFANHTIDSICTPDLSGVMAKVAGKLSGLISAARQSLTLHWAPLTMDRPGRNGLDDRGGRSR